MQNIDTSALATAKAKLDAAEAQREEVLLRHIANGVDIRSRNVEIVVSLAVLYATFMAMVWLAAKIYRVGIFMYGKKPTFKELYKWIRYKY